MIEKTNTIAENFNFSNCYVNLLPVYVETSSTRIGSISFRKFQEEFKNSTLHWNILQTPTGSGKTLAILAKILFNTQSKNGIFIYPTNELIKDQLISIKNLIEKLGFKAKIIDVEILTGEDVSWNQNLFMELKNKRPVVLFAINSLTLYQLASEENSSKGKILFGILNIINASQIPNILLTNLDTLYLILRNKFKDSFRILDLLINWRHIVIDEFHLYSGISLVNLIYTILIYYIFIKRHVSGDFSINLLSATPSDALELIKEVFRSEGSIFKTQCFYSIDNVTLENYSEIRKSTKIFFDGRPNFLYTLNDMEYLYKIVKFIIELPNFNNKENIDKNIRLLILVNSMIFAENFYKYLKNKFEKEKINLPITRIHGMIPPIRRDRINELKGTILIGTRAIEIGIDFDVPFLIFESFDKATFFQRLGRGGRHNECIQFCITSNLLVSNIKNTVHNHQINLDRLVQIVTDSLKEEKSYSDIIFNEEGLALLRPFIESLTDNVEQQKSFLEELSSILNYCSRNLPIDKWNTCIRFPSIRKYLKNAISARSNLIDFPCYLKEFDYWTRLSISELNNCNFYVTTYKDLQNKSPWRLWTKNFDQSVVYVSNFKNVRSNLKIGVIGQKPKIAQIYFTSDKFGLYIEGDLNSKDKEALNKILSSIKIPFVVIDSYVLDWRIPQFNYIDNVRLKIVLGENAFLAKYLHRMRQHEP